MLLLLPGCGRLRNFLIPIALLDLELLASKYLRSESYDRFDFKKAAPVSFLSGYIHVYIRHSLLQVGNQILVCMQPGDKTGPKDIHIKKVKRQ